MADAFDGKFGTGRVKPKISAVRTCTSWFGVQERWKHDFVVGSWSMNAISSFNYQLTHNIHLRNYKWMIKTV
jgi:hypothetical protein